MIRCDLYIYVLFYFILKFRHLLVLRGTVYFQFQLAFPSFRVVFFFIREFRSFGLIYLTNLLAKLSTHTHRHTASQLSVTHVFQILLYLVSTTGCYFTFSAAFWGVTASTITCDNCNTRQQKRQMHSKNTDAFWPSHRTLEQSIAQVETIKKYNIIITHRSVGKVAVEKPHARTSLFYETKRVESAPQLNLAFSFWLWLDDPRSTLPISICSPWAVLL